MTRSMHCLADMVQCASAPEVTGKESQVFGTLIVDDSALVRDFLTRSLSQFQWVEVLGTAVDGHDALEKAAYLNPDLVVLDIEMPHMGGLETARRLKVQSPETRILLISSHEDLYDQKTAASVGADGFVAKTRQLPASLANQILRVFHRP